MLEQVCVRYRKLAFEDQNPPEQLDQRIANITHCLRDRDLFQHTVQVNSFLMSLSTTKGVTSDLRGIIFKETFSIPKVS
jgi:hypothetical protein